MAWRVGLLIFFINLIDFIEFSWLSKTDTFFTVKLSLHSTYLTIKIASEVYNWLVVKLTEVWFGCKKVCNFWHQPVYCQPVWIWRSPFGNINYNAKRSLNPTQDQPDLGHPNANLSRDPRLCGGNSDIVSEWFCFDLSASVELRCVGHCFCCCVPRCQYLAALIDDLHRKNRCVVAFAYLLWCGQLNDLTTFASGFVIFGVVVVNRRGANTFGVQFPAPVVFWWSWPFGGNAMIDWYLAAGLRGP